MAGGETEGGSITAASSTTTITGAPAPATAVVAGAGAGAAGAAAMEVEDEGGFVQMEIDDDESDDEEGEGGGTRKGLSVDRGQPVAKGCFSLTKIGQIKAEWALRGAPTGYEAVVAWPKDKVKELQPYGIILRKKEDGEDVFYFFCLVTALSVKDIKPARADEGERSAASSTRLAPLFKKQKQMAPLAQDAVSMGLLSLGGGGAARAGVGEERSPAAEAQVLLDKYKERAAELATPAFVAEYPPEAVGMWWRQQPDDALKAVARAVLGQCPSSAPLENYFSTAADIATRRRASLDPCRVEMLLVCNVLRRHLKRFPLHDIMTIAEDKVADFLPSRFTRDELKKQLELFGQLLEEGTAGQDQEDDGADQVQELAGWSSLADEWDIEGLDLETAQPTVNLPPAPAAAAAAAAAASD